MKHLVFICHTTQPFDARSGDTRGLGGAETTFIELSEALAKLGYRVTVLTGTDSLSQHRGVEWRPFGGLNQLSADVIVSCNDALCFNLLNPADARLMRKIIWLHNPLRVEKAIRKGQYLPLLKHRPDMVCVGAYLLGRTSRLLPFRKRHVIGHGVSAAFLSLPPAPLEQRSNRVVWVSQPQRGLRETLALWVKTVLPAVPDAEFHLFGITPQHCGMTQQQLDDAHIILQPRANKQELAGFYNTAKLLFYPGASDETFCLAAAEAQCMGIPVVTRGIGSLAERVQHGVSGLIAQTEAQFAQYATDVLQQPALWKTAKR